MSRTYRKSKPYYGGWTYWWLGGSHGLYERGTPLDKKTKALLKRDRHNSSNHYYFNQIARTGRRNHKEQVYKLQGLEDYEDFCYDPSKYEKKRRGIWWEIY